MKYNNIKEWRIAKGNRNQRLLYNALSKHLGVSDSRLANKMKQWSIPKINEWVRERGLAPDLKEGDIVLFKNGKIKHGVVIETGNLIQIKETFSGERYMRPRLQLLYIAGKEDVK